MSRLRTDRYAETVIIRGRGRRLARALVLLLAAALIAQLVHVALAGEALPAEAPDFALKSTAGPNIRLSEYRSDVVAIAFWASWCGECREGLPALERLQRSLGGEGLQVLAVSFDHDPGDAAAAARAAGVSYPVLLDAEGATGRLYDVDDLPKLVLVDRGGRLRGSFSSDGGDIERSVAGEIRALLAE